VSERRFDTGRYHHHHPVGVAILVVPGLLNYNVAIYLILIGIIGLAARL